MIIDQLNAISTPLNTDELPIERGQLTYKITFGDLVEDITTAIGDIENDVVQLQTDVGDVSTLDTTASTVVGAINEVNGIATNAILQPSEAFPLPATGNSSVTKSMQGITENHVLIKWNFSSSAENAPPVDLTWETGNGYFIITNDSGTTSESIQPVFALPTAVTAT